MGGIQTYISSEQQAEMTKSWSKMAFGLALISIAFIAIASSQPYKEDYALDDGDIDYMDNSLRDLIHETPKKRFYFTKIYDKRRICIPPQMSCNALPKLCCGETTCRCNLWGQNCRCLRMGLFQRWGNKLKQESFASSSDSVFK